MTKGLRQDLVDRGIPGDKVVVVRNGADTNRFTPRPKDPALVEKLGLQGKFVVGYYGTMAWARACRPPSMPGPSCVTATTS